MWLFLLGICGVLFKFISSFFFLVLYPNVLLSRWREYLLSALLGFFFLVWRFQGWATLNGEEIPAESGKA